MSGQRNPTDDLRDGLDRWAGSCFSHELVYVERAEKALAAVEELARAAEATLERDEAYHGPILLHWLAPLAAALRPFGGDAA